MKVNHLPKVQNHLKEVREAKGYNQITLAEAVGLNRNSINKIELGRTCPTIGTCLRICRVLSVELNDVWELEEITEEGTDI